MYDGTVWRYQEQPPQGIASHEVHSRASLAVFLDLAVREKLLDGPHQLLGVGAKPTVDFFDAHSGLVGGEQLEDAVSEGIKLVG